MKRIARKMLAAGLALALLAPCMAWAEESGTGTLGVRDFLSVRAALPENFDALVIRDFEGATAQMGDVTVSVRDAVTDGVGVYVTLAYTANNPGDVVLSEFDYDLSNTPWKASQAVLDEQRESEGNRIVVAGVWPTLTEEYGEEQQPLSWSAYVGDDYMYESAGTLVVNTMLDLRRIDWTGDTLPLTFAPFTVDTSNQEEWARIDEARIDIEIPITQMPQTRLTGEVPAEIFDETITEAKLLLTPFASYLDITYEGAPYDGDPQEDTEAFEAYMNRMSGLWLVPLDANGEAYAMLVAAQIFDEGPEDAEELIAHTQRMILSAMRGTPETLTVGVFSAETGELIGEETATLALTR